MKSFKLKLPIEHLPVIISLAIIDLKEFRSMQSRTKVDDKLFYRELKLCACNNPFSRHVLDGEKIFFRLNEQILKPFWAVQQLTKFEVLTWTLQQHWQFKIKPLTWTVQQLKLNNWRFKFLKLKPKTYSNHQKFIVQNHSTVDYAKPFKVAIERLSNNNY